MSSKDPAKITIELTELEAKANLTLITWFFTLRQSRKLSTLGIKQHSVAALARVSSKLNEKL